MLRAEVVDAAYQIHPPLQRLHLVGQAPTSTHQARQPGTEPGVDPLDVRRVDLPARPGPLQHPADPTDAAPDHPPAVLPQISSACTCCRSTTGVRRKW